MSGEYYNINSDVEKEDYKISARLALTLSLSLLCLDFEIQKKDYHFKVNLFISSFEVFSCPELFFSFYTFFPFYE